MTELLQYLPLLIPILLIEWALPLRPSSISCGIKRTAAETGHCGSLFPSL